MVVEVLKRRATVAARRQSRQREPVLNSLGSSAAVGTDGGGRSMTHRL